MVNSVVGHRNLDCVQNGTDYIKRCNVYCTLESTLSGKRSEFTHGNNFLLISIDMCNIATIKTYFPFDNVFAPHDGSLSIMTFGKLSKSSMELISGILIGSKMKCVPTQH